MTFLFQQNFTNNTCICNIHNQDQARVHIYSIKFQEQLESTITINNCNLQSMQQLLLLLRRKVKNRDDSLTATVLASNAFKKTFSFKSKRTI